jgi:hypothetical protein
MMSFVSIPLVTVAWLLVAYTIAFSEDGAGGLIGNFRHVGMLGIGPDTAHGAVPELLASPCSAGSRSNRSVTAGPPRSARHRVWSPASSPSLRLAEL